MLQILFTPLTIALIFVIFVDGVELSTGFVLEEFSRRLLNRETAKRTKLLVVSKPEDSILVKLVKEQEGSYVLTKTDEVNAIDKIWWKPLKPKPGRIWLIFIDVEGSETATLHSA